MGVTINLVMARTYQQRLLILQENCCLEMDDFFTKTNSTLYCKTIIPSILCGKCDMGLLIPFKSMIHVDDFECIHLRATKY